MPERRTRRAAVIVFIEAEGVDERDAGRLGEIALSHTLGPWPRTLHTGETGEVTIIGAIEAGRYLWARTRETGMEVPDA